MEATTTSSLPGCNGHFAFPLPPKSLRPMSASSLGQSLSDSDSQSDSGHHLSQSSPIACRYPLFAFRGYQSDGSPVSLHSLPRLLPPIGVFWDIENCQVPKGRSAVAVAQVIRDRFFTGYREAEFLVVCDVKKENNQVIQELNDAQVNLIHVASTCKNAADEKLRQSIRRFADIYGSPAAIILISGDINFAADITDLRHRKKIHVILLHKNNTSEALILCASEHYNFSELVEPLPPRGFIKSCSKPTEILVSNLPEDMDPARLKSRLRQLSDNCGGRVGTINKNSATIRFSSVDAATRAQKRMEGEDVYGNKISVSYPNKVFERDKQNISPLKSQNRNMQGRKIRSISRGEENLSPLNSSTNNPHQTRSHPVISRFLSNSVTNGRSKSVNGLQTAQTKENCLFMKPEDNQTPPQELEENSRSYSPYSGLWDHEIWTSRNSPFNENKQLLLGCSTLPEKTPEGYRRIRGSHIGLDHLSQAEEVAAVNIMSSSHVYKPIPQQYNRPSSPMTLASLNLATLPCKRSGVGRGGRCEDFQWSPILSGDAVGNQDLQSSFVICPSSNELLMGNGSSKLRSRTPTPVSIPSTSPLTLPYDGDSEESEHFFHPISKTPKVTQNGGPSREPVELHVTNLDPTIGLKDMRRILISLFRECVMVQNISVFTQSDGNLNAIVKVSSSHDAQYAISKLQRRKIGLKRINISRSSNSGPSPHVIRSQILTLLSEVPEHKLPLFTFCELFESRYLSSISMSDICKAKDVCTVSDGPSGRMVVLHPDHRNTPSPVLPTMENGQAVGLPYCPLHTFKPQPNKGWAEQKVAALPSVMIGLKVLAIRIHSLLQSHNGSLHLSSLPICYKSHFESLREDENGVPLEHLVSCLPGVEIYQSASNIKYVRWQKARPTVDSQESGESTKSFSPPLASQLALFSRELVDLLKTSQRCQLPFSRFIPAYHHHFGRQCRVADYGFTKLLELLEALPHVVQVMGEGNKRVITLSHRVQIRRFTSDLLRVLRLQANKQLMASDFPVLYQQVFNRPWDVTNYGVCELRDILSEVSDTTLVVVPRGEDIHISIPKREQTPEEIEKTKQFAAEVVELLRHAPNCSMLFNKFIPAHHLQFGWQCRVADYGFTKLIELFEAIPDVVKVEVIDGERRLTLTLKEKLKFFADQVITLINLSRRPFLTLPALSSAYLRQFGHALCPEAFDCSSLEELVGKIPAAVELLHSQAGPVVALVDHANEQCVQNILMDLPDCRMEYPELVKTVQNYFNQTITLSQIRNLQHVQVTEVAGKIILQLSPLRIFARNMRNLLVQSNGSLPLSLVESSYLRVYGVPCQPAQFGFTSLGALLQSIPDIVQLRGRGNRRTVYLCQKTPLITNNLLNKEESTDTWLERNDDYSASASFEPSSSETTNSNSSKCGDGSSSSDSRVQFPNKYDLPEILTELTSGSSQGCDLIEPEKPCSPKKVYYPYPASGLWASVWSAENYQDTAFTPVMGPSNPAWRSSNHNSPAVLLSPSSNLLSAYSSPKRSPQMFFLPHIVPPEPSELPLPQLSSGPLSVRNASSSLNTSVDEASSLENTLLEKSAADSSPGTPNRNRRKRRLAAQFNTPIDLP